MKEDSIHGEPPWFGPYPDLRLGATLNSRKRQEGGYAALARAISAASPELRKNADTDVIDRRKLKLLVEGGPTEPVLSISELRALDSYLERFGQGLAYLPLFVKPNLMQMIADSGRVTFLLGSREDGKYATFSHWDVLAMAEIQRNVSATGQGVRFEILEVPLEDGPEAYGRWIETLEERGSVVCIGSSRAIRATEEMKCRMYERNAFLDAPLEEKLELPFHFVWNQSVPRSYGSSFRLEPSEIPAPKPGVLDRIEAGASALVVGEDVMVDGVSSVLHGYTYAACVAQRRGHGGTWLVLAGITGPATFAAARAANRLTVGIPEPEPGMHSAPYSWVIRGTVAKEERDRLRTVREFSEEVYKPPFAWAPPPAQASAAS